MLVFTAILVFSPVLYDYHRRGGILLFLFPINTIRYLEFKYKHTSSIRSGWNGKQTGKHIISCISSAPSFFVILHFIWCVYIVKWECQAQCEKEFYGSQHYVVIYLKRILKKSMFFLNMVINKRFYTRRILLHCWYMFFYHTRI